MLAESKTKQLPFAAASAADSNAASAAILSEFSTIGQRRTTSNLTSNGSKLRCFAIKLGAKGAATCSKILDTVNHYMPNCQKKKSSSKKDKCEKNDLDSEKGASPSQPAEPEIPKMMPSRFFNFQRPGCSSDEFADKGASIYLPDGDDGVSSRNGPPLFPMEDCLPPPNYYPFDAGASFTCLSNCFEGHESFKMLITGKGLHGCWPGKSPTCSDKGSHTAARQRVDCRKLENGCFSSHSRWSPRMQKAAQQNPTPNLVVYVPRRNGNVPKNRAATSPSVSEKSCEATSQPQNKGGTNDNMGWLNESQQDLAKRHSFSSASTVIVDEFPHSTMLSLEFSDSQD